MGDAVVNPAEPEVPAQSFPQRLIGVFISPSETFEDVARKPDFWAPLITLLIGSVAFVETMLWKIGMERLVRSQLEQNPRTANMSPEDMDKAVATGAKIGSIFWHVGGIVGPPIALLIFAGIGILIVNVILGGRASFKTVFSTVCYANLVTLIGTIMAIALIFFGDPDRFNPASAIPSSVGFFLNQKEVSKPLYSLASSFDIFSIWFMILLGIGLSKATGGKVKSMPIFLVFAGFWLLYVLAKAGLSMIGS